MPGRAFLLLLLTLIGLVILTSPPLLSRLLRVDPTPTVTATPIIPTPTVTLTPDPFAAVPTATPLNGQTAVIQSLPTTNSILDLRPVPRPGVLTIDDFSEVVSPTHPLEERP